jgi:hypothetical protein
MEIAISLDAYDDLFSDFDIRGYADRALSKDFLDELHLRMRRARDRSGLEIALLVPEERRDLAGEEQIIGRLRRFYAEREAHCVKEDRNAALRGLAFIGTGLALSVLANFIVGRFLSMPLFNDFLLIPSWFFVWSGFDYLTKREELRKKRRYYAELSASRTTFKGRPGPLDRRPGLG